MKAPVWFLAIMVLILGLVLWLPSGLTSATSLPSSSFQISNLPSPTFTPPSQATATPPGAATPTPVPGCQQLLVNGGFENNDGWTFKNFCNIPAGYATDIVHSGLRSMRAPVAGYADTYAYSDGDQFVTLPAGTKSAVLDFWWYPISAEPALSAAESMPSLDMLRAAATHSVAAAATSGDIQYVLILDSSGNTIATLLWTRSNAQTWQERSLAIPASVLTAQSGKTIRVKFGVFNNGDGRRTTMYIDDASLVVCPTIQPTVTPTPTGTTTPGVTPSPTGVQTGAQLLLSPSTTVASTFQVFTVTIVANTGIATADTVDAYLNFDPTLLEVVDATGSADDLDHT